MGAWYGMAKRADNFGYPDRSILFRVLAVLVPMLLHGMYDFIATRATDSHTWVFVIFVVIMFFISFKLVRKLSDQDRYIV